MRFLVIILAIALSGCASIETTWDNLPPARVIGTADIESLPADIGALALMKRWGRPQAFSREAVLVYPTAIRGVTVNVALRVRDYSIPMDIEAAEVRSIFLWADKKIINNPLWNSSKQDEN